MSIHLENAARVNKGTFDVVSKAVIDLLIEHIKQQDKRIADLEKLVDRLDGENSLNRPLI